MATTNEGVYWYERVPLAWKGGKLVARPSDGAEGVEKAWEPAARDLCAALAADRAKAWGVIPVNGRRMILAQGWSGRGQYEGQQAVERAQYALSPDLCDLRGAFLVVYDTAGRADLPPALLLVPSPSCFPVPCDA